MDLLYQEGPRKATARGGEAALQGRKPNVKNRMDPAVERAVLDFTFH